MVNIRRIKVSAVEELDEGLYEVVTADRVFSYIVHSPVKLLKGDFISVYFEFIGAFVVKVARQGEVVYVQT